MRTIHRAWEPDQTPVLLFLWRLAAEEGGYELRGVRGWAHLDDVEEGVGREILDLLPLLHRRRLLDRADAPAPGRTLAARLHRVSEAGARAVAERTGAVPGRLPAPGPPECAPPCYVPRTKRRVLSLLCAAYGDPAAPLHFGEPGWATARELGAGARSGADPSGFVAELRWLLRAGLVERRSAPGPHVREPSIHWRVTAAGRGARILEWHDPGAST